MTATPLPRSAFPAAARWTYLNHAGAGVLPASSAAALHAYADAVRDDGGEEWAVHAAREADVRHSAALLLGVAEPDVSFVKNTTEALSFVTEGLTWSPGDRVVVPGCEFPSNFFPWLALRARGVEVVLVEPSGDGECLGIEAFERALDGRPARVVAVSWVQYGCGWRVDLDQLGRLARDHEALFVVDAIQGLGVLPALMGEWGVDLACAAAHKWLLGPDGFGVMSTSTRARAELRVTQPGWNAGIHRDAWEGQPLVLDPSGRRFEGGTQNIGGMMALGASLDLLLETGVDKIWRHVDALCDRLVRGLEDVGARVLTDRSRSGASGIVTFTVPAAEPEPLAAQLRGRRFAVRARGGGVRVSPHGYNTPGEIDAFVEAVRTLG